MRSKHPPTPGKTEDECVRRFKRPPTQQTDANVSPRSTHRLDEKLLICLLPVPGHQETPLDVITQTSSHIMSAKELRLVFGSGRTGPFFFFFFRGSCHSLTNDCNKRLAQRSNSVMQRNSKALAGRCAANLTNKSSGAEESAPPPPLHTHTPTLIYMVLQDCTLKLLELL